MTSRLSIVIPARNAPEVLHDCLRSVQLTVAALELEPRTDFILIDDASDEKCGITDAFIEFRSVIRAETTVLRTRTQQHYTRACAIGLSLARGQLVLLLTHDMVVTPYYLRTLLEVIELEPDIGILRGTSDYVDCFPRHQLRPPLPARSLSEVFAFSKLVRSYAGLRYEEDAFLTGDAFLVQRAVLDRIGVMDSRYFGYFGDIDFGLRAQRAGFRLGCAKGAWLRHVGAAYYKTHAARSGLPYAEVHAARMAVVQAAYEEFRQKWQPELPEKYVSVERLDFAALCARSIAASDRETPLEPSAIPAEWM